MARSATLDFLRPEFDPFLHASIGVDRNGMPLSVLSVLARMDIDPWQEAARLAALPQDAATRSLEALLASQPGAQPQTAEPSAAQSSATQSTVAQPDRKGFAAGGGAIAAPLIALLPRRAGANLQPGVKMPYPGRTAGHHVQLSMVLWLILMAIMLGMEALAAGRRLPARTAQASPPASSASASGRPASVKTLP